MAARILTRFFAVTVVLVLLLAPKNAEAGYWIGERYVATGGDTVPAGQTILTPDGQTITSDGNGNLVRTGNGSYEYWNNGNLSQIYQIPAGTNQASSGVTIGYMASTNGVLPGYYRTGGVASTLTSASNPVQAAEQAAQQLTNRGIAAALSNIVDQLLKGAGQILAWVGYVIFWLASAWLFIASSVLSMGFDVLVNKMGTYTALWDGVKVGWATIRDIGNTLFIFVLLFAAFNTVLGRKNGLELVPRIIIVALLINFSFLFSTAIIDLSNEMASRIHAELNGDGNFSGQMAKLSGVADATKDFLSLDAAKAKVQQGMQGQGGTFAGVDIFIKAIFSSAFLFILGGFFFAIVFTLLSRFVVLVVLCLVSALAFLAYLLPRFEAQSREWWSTLIGQAFYAPAVFLMLLVTTGIAETFNQGFAATSANMDTAGNVQSLISMTIGRFFQFFLLMGMLYASMALARKLSEQGSQAALNVGKGAQRMAAGVAFGTSGYALRGSLGRLGASLSNNDWLKKQSVKGGVWGAANRRLLGVAGKAESSSFDARRTGVAAAIAAQGNVNLGAPSDRVAKGWKGIADAREKKVADRIAEVRKMDLTADDRKKAIEKLLKEHRNEDGSFKSTDIGQALARAQQAKTAYTDGKAAGKTGQELEDLKKEMDEARKKRDELVNRTFNKKVFGINRSDRTMNYSTRYAESIHRSANGRLALMRNMGVAASLGVGVGGLALFAPGAALAAGTLAGGSAISRVARGFRNADQTYMNRQGQNVRQGFWRAALRTQQQQAAHNASSAALARERKYQEWREKQTALEDLRNSGTPLSDQQKEELADLRKKIEKHESPS